MLLAIAAVGCHHGDGGDVRLQHAPRAAPEATAGPQDDPGRLEATRRQPPAEAERTPFDIAIARVAPPTAEARPARNDTVVIRYSVWNTGSEVRATADGRRSAMEVSLADSGDGFADAMQRVAVGERVVMWMTPMELFGPRMHRAPRDLLVIDVELVDIRRAPPTPDLRGPAATSVSGSGIAHITLQPGRVTDAPSLHDEVVVRLTGWTWDGRMLETTELGEPRRTHVFAMDRWLRETVQAMTVGEARRVWVPWHQTDLYLEDLEPIIYDVELVSIERKPAPPAPPSDVSLPPSIERSTDGGVVYRVIEPGGGGEPPEKGDTVVIDYTGWTADGLLFSSTVVEGQPETVVLGRILPGLTEAVSTMTVGSRALFWIPEGLAYRGRLGPNGHVVFEIALRRIERRAARHEPPANVAEPPANALTTPGGVAYVVLETGAGGRTPTSQDLVDVHFTAWSSEGDLLATTDDGPAMRVVVGSAIAGWREVLPLLEPGARVIVWVPATLAYRPGLGRRVGPRVFDMRLVGIVE